LRLRSRLRECLCLNWAVPVENLPPPPEPLRYQLHAAGGSDFVLASVLLFRHEEVQPELLPLFRFSFPQLNLRTYVLDDQDVPAVLFAAILVPPWVVPSAVLVGGQPARRARFEHRGEPGSGAGSWRWRVRAPTPATRGGGAARGAANSAALDCVAELGSPKVGEGPQIGTWQQTVDFVRLRNRGYARSRSGLKRIETEQPAVAVSPVDVELRDAELPRLLLGAPSWPGLHSAWVCPEMTMRFDLAPERALALPRQAPVPG